MSPSAGPAPTATGFLLALLCSYACFRGADSAPKHRPGIDSSLRFKPSLGQRLVVSCEGHSTYLDSGIIYWLANGSFVEELYKEGAVKEGEPEEKFEDNSVFLKRTLTFRSFSEKDQDTTFQCIVMDPSGRSQKTVTWESKEPQRKRTAQGTNDSGSGVSEGY